MSNVCVLQGVTQEIGGAKGGNEGKRREKGKLEERLKVKTQIAKGKISQKAFFMDFCVKISGFDREICDFTEKVMNFCGLEVMNSSPCCDKTDHSPRTYNCGKPLLPLPWSVGPSSLNQSVSTS